MRDNIEDLIKKADFSKGSNQKAELKKEQFGDVTMMCIEYFG